MGNGTLEIMLVEAQDLNEGNTCLLGCFVKPWKRATKPYAHIVYMNQEHTSSVVKLKGRGKERGWKWNEKFSFEAKYPHGELQDHLYKFVIRLMDKQKFSDDVLLGETTVYVKEILSMGMEKGKVEVGSRKYRVVESDKTYSGEISVAITFIQDREEITEEFGGQTEI